MKVVTSGYTYLDIDGYGGCIAYAELLRAQGQAAIAASNAILNESITQTVRAWGGELRQNYSAQPGDTFVLVDLSDPAFFDTCVQQDAVTEIIDHHPGFEVYWHDRLGDKADIRFVGAACTLVAERFIAAGELSQISQTSARLLLTGILDNTLNFRAHITTDRDKAAYSQLLAKANLPDDWPAHYFRECQQAITSSLEIAIKHDMKQMDRAKFQALPQWFGQVVIWDAATLLSENKSQIMQLMHVIAKSGGWGMNVVSINEHKSYILAENPSVQENFARILGVTFKEQTAIANRLWMRKEIMKASLQA